MSIYIIGFHFTCTCTTTCEYAVLLGSKITVPFGSNLICKKKLFTHMFHFPTSPKSSLWVLALAASKQFKVHGISRAFFMLSFFIRTWIQDMVSKNNQKKNHDSFKLWIRVAKSWEYTEKHWLFSKLVIIMIIYQVWSHFKNKK